MKIPPPDEIRRLIWCRANARAWLADYRFF